MKVYATTHNEYYGELQRENLVKVYSIKKDQPVLLDEFIVDKGTDLHAFIKERLGKVTVTIL